jgi:hypothetical protein
MGTADPAQELLRAVLGIIGEIKPSLDPLQIFLLGSDATDAMTNQWAELERRIGSAKLAIIRDEVSVRFPTLAAATYAFTFGITDAAADRYLTFLEPRKQDDILQMTFTIIEEVFGANPKIPDIAHYASNLSQTLQSYSQQVEDMLHPFALKIGRPA